MQWKEELGLASAGDARDGFDDQSEFVEIRKRDLR